MPEPPSIGNFFEVLAVKPQKHKKKLPKVGKEKIFRRGGGGIISKQNIYSPLVHRKWVETFVIFKTDEKRFFLIVEIIIVLYSGSSTSPPVSAGDRIHGYYH